MCMYLSVSLGNDNIHQITSHGSYRLTVTLTDWDGTTAYAIYSNFSIASEADAYRLSVIHFAGGDAGNRLAPAWVIKLSSCSTQLTMKSKLLINIKTAKINIILWFKSSTIYSAKFD